MAIGYASRYLCSESRLLEYLEKKGCGEHAQQIINRLKEIGVLDEFRSCELLAESYAKKFGRFSIEQKLRKRGFSNEIIKQVLKKSSYESEFNTAVEIARTKLKKLESAHSKDIKNKLLRFLASRGFSIDVCLKAVSKAMAEFKENQED
ncbi:MAG: RecX family transcriptional regulator [Actinobacteria bacterium]|nr:RecX family transcriptional regulator [Actinomycetota bacterium]